MSPGQSLVGWARRPGFGLPLWAVVAAEGFEQKGRQQPAADPRDWGRGAATWTRLPLPANRCIFKNLSIHHKLVNQEYAGYVLEARRSEANVDLST